MHVWDGARARKEVSWAGLHPFNNTRMCGVLPAVVCVVLLTGAPALAGLITVDLVDPATGDDSGWDAVYDDSLNVSFGVQGVTVDSTVVIEIQKTFTDPPVGGSIPPIDIEFQPDPAGAVPVIWIADEIIINNTGVPWTDFHWELDGAAVFDATQGFVSIDPFTNSQYSVGNTVYSVDGGTLSHVAPDNVWFVGTGIPGGNLKIDASGTFTLSEYPTVTPEPFTALLLSVVGVSVLLPGRSRSEKRLTSTQLSD